LRQLIPPFINIVRSLLGFNTIETHEGGNELDIASFYLLEPDVGFVVTLATRLNQFCDVDLSVTNQRFTIAHHIYNLDDTCLSRFDDGYMEYFVPMRNFVLRVFRFLS
jgi:hypothetical protein